MTYEESIPKNITTTQTSRPNTPQVKIRNPQDADIFVNLIEILPNVDFALDGKIIILINGVPVLDESFDFFRQYSKYPLPLGKKLERGQYVEIFVWNGTNSDSIRCDFNIHLSSEQKLIPSVATPLTNDEKNIARSESENIFPIESRNVGSYPALVDMKGYKKLILSLGGATITYSIVDFPSYTEPPYLKINYAGTTLTDLDLITDGFAIGWDVGSNPQRMMALDFGDNKARKLSLALKWDYLTGVSSARHRIYSSEDGVIWTLQNDTTKSGSSPTDENQTVSFDTTCRYLKMLIDSISGIGIIFYNEIYDRNEFGGGSAAVSFEIKDINGSWIEFIPSSEFGTVSTGTSIVKQLGDVTTKSISGETYALPSTQTDFRAKLTITIGLFRNGVKILRVA